MQFGFSEASIVDRVHRAVALEEDLSDTEILIRVLFSPSITINDSLVNIFRAKIGQGVSWVVAYYYTYYTQMGLTPDRVMVAARQYVEALDTHGYQPGVYDRIAYEQYGFPRALAQAAADCLRGFDERYAGSDRQRRFWWAGFRVLGVPEHALTRAYAAMLQGSDDSVQRMFEHAYVEAIAGNAINTDSFFCELDDLLMRCEGEESRIETLLELLWARLFPDVSDVKRAQALQGFLESPSTGEVIIAMLAVFKCN
jgi:hypothetical protein